MNAKRPSYTREDYLKVIFELTRNSREQLAPMGEIAGLLGLTAGSVTTMVQRLKAEGLVEYSPRLGCKLTAEGRIMSLQILRRHRVLETFLVQCLGMDWSGVHEEAERMEHGTSNEVIDKIWEFLGCPDVDPYGGFIPNKDLELPERTEDFPVSSLHDGDEGVITRFSDRNPDLLKALQNAGMLPGTRFVLKRQDGTGVVQAECPGGNLTVSETIASLIHCE